MAGAGIDVGFVAWVCVEVRVGERGSAMQGRVIGLGFEYTGRVGSIRMICAW